jgi:hypothetical protein
MSFTSSDSVDSIWAASAGGMSIDDLPDVKIGAPYPASGVTLYEGNQVRYKTTYDANNYGWSIETDDARRMPIRQRTWGPSGEYPYLTQGPTDEVPQVKFYYPPQGVGGLSASAGPSFVAVDEAAEARARERTAAYDNDVRAYQGGFFAIAGAQAGRLVGRDEASASQGIALGESLMNAAGARTTFGWTAPRTGYVSSAPYARTPLATRPMSSGLAGSYAQQKVSPTSVTFNINSGQSQSVQSTRPSYASRVDLTGKFKIKPLANGTVSVKYENPNRHGIAAIVEADGTLAFDVNAGGNVSKLGSGKDMFYSMMQELAAKDIQVNRIRGLWYPGAKSTNFTMYQTGRWSGLAPQEAALNTWTGDARARIRIYACTACGRHECRCKGFVC